MVGNFFSSVVKVAELNVWAATVVSISLAPGGFKAGGLGLCSPPASTSAA